MYRGLILGTIAFGAVFFAERQLPALGKDIKRYNDMRAMSGDPPVTRQAVELLTAMVKSYLKEHRGATADLARTLSSDALRYARISTM